MELEVVLMISFVAYLAINVFAMESRPQEALEIFFLTSVLEGVFLTIITIYEFDTDSKAGILAFGLVLTQAVIIFFVLM